MMSFVRVIPTPRAFFHDEALGFDVTYLMLVVTVHTPVITRSQRLTLPLTRDQHIRVILQHHI
jgi:hypothetical protein